MDMFLCDLKLGLQPKLAGIKHLNRLENVLARMEWSEDNIADGLLLDSNDHVIECLKEKGMLGVAMGSSEAVGFMDKRGRILGWLNELAFAPVDYNPKAPADEWSGDQGVGALYFSQQAVNKLLPAAKIKLRLMIA